ncbi:hypothetical protein BG910_05320 [Neisseria chenwenguii]|uniref:Uncharacterized protein n=2 Tax=Neisseria chenwenguii TaxID=1853278 RepID=A0A220S1B8_9NEIS|nr:hypothetical protein BG910_05320 [Neisseria chenwenguii]
MTQNLAQYSGFDDKTNAARGKFFGGVTAFQAVDRLRDNFEGFIADHQKEVVDIIKIQAIMSGTSAIASFLMSDKIPAGGIFLIELQQPLQLFHWYILVAKCLLMTFTI